MFEIPRCSKWTSNINIINQPTEVPPLQLCHFVHHSYHMQPHGRRFAGERYDSGPRRPWRKESVHLRADPKVGSCCFYLIPDFYDILCVFFNFIPDFYDILWFDGFTSNHTRGAKLWKIEHQGRLDAFWQICRENLAAINLCQQPA